MVRPGYRLNNSVRRPIFPLPKHNLPDGLTGFRKMNPDWGIDWARFIDTEIREYDGPLHVRQQRLQFAYRIDTSLVYPLGHLPIPVAAGPSSLAERNLLHGWRLGLPSGQDVARAMGIPPLPDKDILIGQGVDKPKPPLKNILDVGKVFADNCPLWTYVLAEAMHHKANVKIPVKEGTVVTTPRLGPVGGRVVSEVFLGMVAGDSDSILGIHPGWVPDPKVGYTLKDFVNYAIGKAKAAPAGR